MDAQVKEVLFRFPKGEIVLNVNPQEYQVTLPTRVDIVQSLTGAYADGFGAGLGTGQISGSFGWGSPLHPVAGRPILNGLEQGVFFKRSYEEWQDLQATSQDPTSIVVQLVNDVDGHFLDIIPQTLTWRRSAARPFSVAYTLAFTIMLDHNAPSRPSARVQLGALPPFAEGGTPEFAPTPTDPWR